MTSPTLQHPTSLKERQRAERETLILDEAERMLSEQGFHDLVMEQLAERVGIGKGTIYLHFPKKEDLVIAIITRGMERFHARIAAVVTNDEASASDRLREAMIIMMNSHLDWLQAIDGPLRHELIDAVKKREDIQRRVRGLFALIGTVIDQGKERGEFTAEIATPVAALALGNMARAIASAQVMGQIDMDPDQISESLVRLFFAGLHARPDEEVSA